MKTQEKKYTIRISDRGALSGVLQFTNTLVLLKSILSIRKLVTTEELLEELKNKLRNTLSWLDRIPDATLYGELSKKQINVIKKDAKTVLSLSLIFIALIAQRIR